MNHSGPAGASAALVAVLLLPVVSAPAQPRPAPAAPPSSTAPAVIDLSDLVPPEREMLDQAVAFQTQGEHARALLLLEDLLRVHPGAPSTEEALYRIALAYRQLGRMAEARRTLALRAERFPAGAWTAPARLLEGELLALDGKWKEALPPLKEAAASTERSIALRAHHLLLLAADQLRDLPSARASIDFLAKPAKDNPHADLARLKQGTLAAAENKPAEAARAFQDVIARSPDSVLRAEAAVRAGNLAYAGSAWKEAVANYETARRTGAPGFWRNLAHLGLVQAHFAAGEHARALEIYREVRPDFPDNARARVLFLAAEAARLSGRADEALEAYAFFLKEFPNDPLAESAAWARLLLLRAGGRPELPGEAAAFLARHPRSERAFQAGLLRAEALAGRGDHAAAAPLFSTLLKDEAGLSALTPEARAGLLYRAAHSAWQNKTPAAVRPPLARLLRDHAESPLVPGALWLDGAAALAGGEKPAALASWTRLIDRHPQWQERPLLLWQAAQLAGNLGQPVDMARFLRLFLAENPRDARVPEGHFLLAGALSREGDGQDARPHWEAARTAQPAAYFATATQQLIRLALLRQDTAGLLALVDEYDAWRARNPKAPAVALEVYEWLGQQLAGGPRTTDAERCLRIVLAGSKDRAQRQRSQLRLAQLLSAQANHGAALKEWTAYRREFPEDANRSSVLEPLARAHLGAAQFDAATALAEQILRQNPEGEFNIRGRLLLGDIAMERRDFRGAAKIFTATALLVEDPVLTPRALASAERAHRRAGSAPEADAALLELKKRFPDYRE